MRVIHHKINLIEKGTQNNWDKLNQIYYQKQGYEILNITFIQVEDPATALAGLWCALNQLHKWRNVLLQINSAFLYQFFILFFQSRFSHPLFVRVWSEKIRPGLFRSGSWGGESQCFLDILPENFNLIINHEL